MLSLLEARKIIDQAIRRARELRINVSVAVCDNTGRLIALNQMDRSCGWESDRCSMGKAVAAAVTGLPSDRLMEHVQNHGLRSSSYNNVVQPRGQRGGLPIVESGFVQGGCGVSGAATAEQDEECARIGIAAIHESVTDSHMVFAN
jgi:glc operon protein GlcG